jgi:hypothetical protein
VTIPELRKDLKFFCSICEQRTDKVIEVIEIDTEKQSYVKRLWCLKCFKRVGEGK